MNWTCFIQIASAFVMLFAIIDPLGSMPIVLNLEQKGDRVNAWKVTIATFILMMRYLIIFLVFRLQIVTLSVSALIGSTVRHNSSSPMHLPLVRLRFLNSHT